MARSTVAMALVMLMLPASARRNKDDTLSMQAGSSGARDLEPELLAWLHEVGLDYADASWWAQKESSHLETCGATLPYLKKLYEKLTVSSGIDLPQGDAIEKMFDYAKKAIDPVQLSNMYWVLYDCHNLCLPKKEEALFGASELLAKGASSGELLKLYKLLSDDNDRYPKKEAMEVAAAGIEVDKYWSAYRDQVSHNKWAAIDEAVRTSFGMQAFRYDESGEYYTASQCQDKYGSNWLEKWNASPAAQKVAEDGKAWTAPQFWEYFNDSWLSKWHEAKWATQKRIANDGHVYTLDEFVKHYGSQWQQKWAEAPVALCEECTAASHSP